MTMASDMSASHICPQNPPITHSTPHIHQHNAGGLSGVADEQSLRFARDIQWKVVGPMPPDTFLDEFLPCSSKVPRFKSVTFSAVPDDPTKESTIYGPLVSSGVLPSLLHSSPTQRDALNVVLAKSNLAFYDTSNRPESPGQVGTSKPDLGMFRKDDVNRGNLKHTHKPAEGGAPGEYVYTARMGEVYMFVEVKTSDDLDPFTDPPGSSTTPGYHFTIDAGQEYPNDRDAKYRVSALGQNTCYAHVVQNRQFRTCVYSISVAGTTARLLRWDRTGVVVTESFNYKSEPGILINFVWRFSKATNEQRGFDGSARAVDSPEERQRFYDAIKKHVQEQLPELSDKEVEEEANRHFCPGVLTRLTVGADEEARDILVSRPMFTSKGATGRSTMGYWGVDCTTDDVVFVKDVWRTDVPDVRTEGAVMKELLEAGVQNIPGLVCHGDVLHNGEAAFLVPANSSRSHFAR